MPRKKKPDSHPSLFGVVEQPEKTHGTTDSTSPAGVVMHEMPEGYPGNAISPAPAGDAAVPAGACVLPVRTPDEDREHAYAGHDEGGNGDTADASEGGLHPIDSGTGDEGYVGLKPLVTRIVDVLELGLPRGSVDEIRVPFLMGREHTPTLGSGVLLHFTDNYYIVIPTSERDVYDLRTFYPEPVADVEAADTLCNRKVILRGGGPEEERTVYLGPWSERMLVKDIGVRTEARAA